jgi:iron complex transport system substrate-binding protein
MRVISLTSSNTEIVSALGFGASLIACDSNSDWPADLVSSLPRLGPDLQIDLEKVAALKPDLVLSSLSVPGMERVIDGLNAIGIPQLVLDPITFDDVLEDVRKVAIALEHPERGEALLLEMRSRIQELRAGVPTFSRPPKVMVEWWPKPVIVATRDSCRDTETVQMLEVLGAENAFAKIEKRSSVISLEAAIATNPDVICCSWCGVKKLRREKILSRDGWQEISAVSKNHVYDVPESFVGRPSPRLLDGLEILAGVLRGVREDDLV